ncbi:D-alanine--D-alanine ligase [Marinomonas foliarum]|jgi:D-alanine-D-alanine ligase|uniref:D-alanine--D-alanine ligase n=1 Tax=Marinomonas foliarum TaxID=491950 RepID=A0A369AIB4_9GAMM|nr:D-alanine--D-alanine ligase [Marinomonas foliarum]QRV23741.1 D-alanine--D-alanine ligase [Marinomonas foliarum]RCX07174.1 D-alanine-D-alanine ligase [Marinomonas foliarum]
MSKTLKEAVIVVIYGGRSAEREVSMQSGPLVAEGLRTKGFQVVELDLYGSSATLDPIVQLQSIEFDLAFIALHGGEGEDGRVQALLEMFGKPYTGSSPLACGLAMDKVLTKRFWHGIGIPTPAYLSFVGHANADVIEEQMSYPVIVKPSREGSTIGINKATNRIELDEALIKALEYDSDVLVEEFVDGPEFTITIIDDVAYPPIGLKPAPDHKLYDYEAKYIADDTEYLLPCGLNEDDENELQMLALDAYRSLGCSGWGRVDVMRDQAGVFWVLEVNTAPGMTSHSLVPMAANYVGIDYASLVEKIAQNAWDKVGRN